MAAMSQMPSALAGPGPAGPPQGQAPLPGPPGGPPPPQGGGAGKGDLLTLLMAFLAGAGLPQILGALTKMMPKHSGAKADAAKSPQQSIPPQMLAQLQQQKLAQAGGGPGGGDPKLQMLIAQLLKGGGAGGA